MANNSHIHSNMHKSNGNLWLLLSGIMQSKPEDSVKA